MSNSSADVGTTVQVAKGDDDKSKKLAEGAKEEDKVASFSELWRFADGNDKALIAGGIFGGSVQGAAMPAFCFLFAELMEAIYEPDPAKAKEDTQAVAMLFLYLAIAIFIATFFNVFCFELVAERLLLKNRKEYFQAVLRQDIAWFDVHGGLQLPTSIAGDTAIMREGVGQKLGNSIVRRTACGFTCLPATSDRLANTSTLSRRVH